MPLHVSSTCAHHQEVKIALHSFWYHHTHRKQILCIKLVKYWDKKNQKIGFRTKTESVYCVVHTESLYIHFVLRRLNSVT